MIATLTCFTGNSWHRPKSNGRIKGKKHNNFWSGFGVEWWSMSPSQVPPHAVAKATAPLYPWEEKGDAINQKSVWSCFSQYIWQYSVLVLSYSRKIYKSVKITFRNTERGLTENILWAFVLTMCLSMCAWLLQDMNSDWENNPVSFFQVLNLPKIF